MTDMIERDYLERRAEDELDCAQRASPPAAVKAHYDLLGRYLDQLYPARTQTPAGGLDPARS
ncbi:hypothetical protein [uncultured Sphingomonas sp.]|uniref:hypothetical protein n=1 Tax=uncultured Sphingomonas sp. TaxID=158754 RepID=UPI0025DB8A9A|nr:hypothetical protein [uncultured Sphingomonas sp.]